MKKESLPIISIVIPTYNHGKHLLRTINSVITQESLKQSYDIEIIIVDDASTDNTEEIIKEIIKNNKDIVIKYIKHKNNLGVDAPVNTGILKAIGDYICVLDADDTFTKNSLKLRLDAIKDNNYTYVVGSILRVDKNNKQYIIKNTDISSFKSILNFLKFHPEHEGLNHCTLFYKREISEKVGLRIEKRDNRSTNNDYEIFLRLLTQIKGLNLSEPLYIYNFYNTSNLNTEGITDLQNRNRELLEKHYIELFENLIH